MSMAMAVKPEGGYLLVRLTGAFSLVEIKELFVQMLDAVALHKANKVLVDCRDIEGGMTMLERFDYAEFGAKELSIWYRKSLSSGVRFAYVSKPPFYDSSKLGENVAVNRGAVVLSTTSMEEALQWLDIAPGGKL
jgi:hypothetical protein